MYSFFGVDRLLGKENYRTWKIAMENLLKREKLWNTIDGTEVDPRKIEKARTKIILTLDPANYVHVENCKSAKEIWDILQGLFDESMLSERVCLMKLLITAKMELNKSVEDYVNEVMYTAIKLSEIGLKLDEDVLVCILLAGLSDEYKQSIVGLENLGVKITPEIVKTILLQSETSNGKQETSEAVLISVEGNKDSKGLNCNEIKSKAARCYACRKVGHLVKDCPFKKKRKRKNANTMHSTEKCLIASKVKLRILEKKQVSSNEVGDNTVVHNGLKRSQLLGDSKQKSKHIEKESLQTSKEGLLKANWSRHYSRMKYGDQKLVNSLVNEVTTLVLDRLKNSSFLAQKKSRMRCFCCGKYGHKRISCRLKKSSESF